jgi:hypothetical protein
MKKKITNTQKDFIQLLETAQPTNDMIIIETPNSRYVFTPKLKDMLIKDAKKLVNISSNKILKSCNSQKYQSLYVWCLSQTKEDLLNYSNKIKKYQGIEKELFDLWELYASHPPQMTWDAYINKAKLLKSKLSEINLPVGGSYFLLDLIETTFLK